MMRWLDRRHAVFAPAGILERCHGLIKDELLSMDKGSLFQIAGGFAVRHPRAGQRAGGDAGLYLEWIFSWYLAAIRLTDWIAAGRQAGPDDPAWAAEGAR